MQGNKWNGGGFQIRRNDPKRIYRIHFLVLAKSFNFDIKNKFRSYTFPQRSKIN